MRIVWLAALAVCVVLTTTVVRAQEPRQLDNRPGTAWQHKPSGLTFPTELAGVQRSAVMAFSDGEWDVSARYDTTGTAITVYVYQAAVFDPAIWFREAQHSIETRKAAYGTATPATAPTAFAPPGDSVSSGLRMVYATTTGYKSTALAVAPLGSEWIVKIRLSSTKRMPAELDADLTALVAALNWPKKVAPHPPARAVADCAQPMPTLERAKPVAGNNAASMFGGLLGSVGTFNGTTSVNLSHCRDVQLSGNFSVYRTEEPSTGYILSLGDSGRAVIVEPDILGVMMAVGGKPPVKPNQGYLVNFVVPGLSTVFGTLDRIPPVDQAIDIVNAGRWVSTTTRERNSKITVNSDTLK